VAATLACSAVSAQPFNPSSERPALPSAGPGRNYRPHTHATDGTQTRHGAPRARMTRPLTFLERVQQRPLSQPISVTWKRLPRFESTSAPRQSVARGPVFPVRNRQERSILIFAWPGGRQLGVSPRDRESESLRRSRGEVSAAWGFFGVGRERSLGSVRDAEMAGCGVENGRQRAKKRATPGGFPLGVACQLAERKFRSRSQGSPRKPGIEQSLGGLSLPSRQVGSLPGMPSAHARRILCGCTLGLGSFSRRIRGRLASSPRISVAVPMTAHTGRIGSVSASADFFLSYDRSSADFYCHSLAVRV